MEEKETRTSDEKSIQQTIDEEKQQKTQDTIKSKVEELLQQKQKNEIKEIKAKVDEIKAKVDEMLQQISTSEKRVKIDVIEKTLQQLYENIYKQLYIMNMTKAKE
jgi:hypothetical protein